MSKITLTEVAAPATPDSGKVAIYAKSDGLVYSKDDVGSETALGGAGLPVADTTSIVEGSGDPTKELRIEVDGLTTGTTRVWTAPDTDLTVTGEANAATLTNKTMSTSANTIGTGAGVIKTLSSDVASAGSDRNLIIAAESGTADNLIEVTGLSVGESALLRADTGDTITVKHNSGSATVKIHLSANADVILDEQNPLRLTLVATNVLVEDRQPTAGGSGAFVSCAVLRDEKTDGTNGGSASATTWNARDLQTEVSNPDSIVTISSNQFTPISGNYLIMVTAAGLSLNGMRLRLYNVTGTAAVEEGLNAGAASASSILNTVSLVSRFTANGTDAYRIEHYATSTKATDGLGAALGDTGSNEVYMEIVLLKYAA
jgi:hypothetical protein